MSSPCKFEIMLTTVLAVMSRLLKFELISGQGRSVAIEKLKCCMLVKNASIELIKHKKYFYETT